jgi:K(+)-stimulated pyrophosphate-energized sodium pump
VEIAVTMTNANLKLGLAVGFLLIALVFVYRSFYRMRISSEKLDG